MYCSGQLIQGYNQKIKCPLLPTVLLPNVFLVPGVGRIFRVLQQSQHDVNANKQVDVHVTSYNY
jgi:hypothetical protein